jgi:hypothetical protein
MQQKSCLEEECNKEKLSIAYLVNPWLALKLLRKENISPALQERAYEIMALAFGPTYNTSVRSRSLFDDLKTEKYINNIHQ